MTKTKETTVLRKVPMDDIYPTAENARHFDPQSPAFLDLVASMREKGQRVPAIGRPHPEFRGKVDLRAGRRRYEAAMVLGFDTLDVLVRDMTDEEALDETILENMQREDLSPMEEAAAVNLLVKSGKTVDQAAERLGKDRRWIARRMSLLNLCNEWVEILNNPDRGFEISLRAQELISRYAPEVQIRMLADAKRETEFGMETITAEWVEQLSTNYHKEMSAAPFDLGDVDLYPAAGACMTCPKRSGCQPLLFEPHEVGGEAQVDMCLDDECWSKKTSAYWDKQVADASDKVGRPVKLAVDVYGHGLPSGLELVRAVDYEKAKKTDAGAVPLLFASGSKAGKVVWMKPRPGMVPQKGMAGGKQTKTLEDRRQDLHKKRVAHIVEQMEAHVNGMTVGDFRLRHDICDTGEMVELMLRYALVFGVNLNSWCDSLHEFGDPGNVFISLYDHDAAIDWLANPPGPQADAVRGRLIDVAAFSVKQGINAAIRIHSAAEDTLKWLCGIVGFAWDLGMEKACEAHPEPKAWAKGAAGQD